MAVNFLAVESVEIDLEVGEVNFVIFVAELFDDEVADGFLVGDIYIEGVGCACDYVLEFAGVHFFYTEAVVVYIGNIAFELGEEGEIFFSHG